MHSIKLKNFRAGIFLGYKIEELKFQKTSAGTSVWIWNLKKESKWGSYNWYQVKS